MHQHPAVEFIRCAQGMHHPACREKLLVPKGRKAKPGYFFWLIILPQGKKKMFSNVLIILSHEIENNQKRNFKNIKWKACL